MTLVQPPDAINALTAGVITSFNLIGMSYYSIYPLPLPNGAPDYTHSFATSSSNSNYTKWIFNVNPGLRWSNGQNASAQDILATFGPNFAFNPQYDFVGGATQVKDEFALNSTAAEFDLNVSDAHFPELISYLFFTPVMPASAIATMGASGSYFTAPTLGPFYIANYTPGAFQMTMFRNPYFTPQPKICEIELNFVESYSLTASSLQSGQTDLAPVEPNNVQAVLGNPNNILYPDTAIGGQSLQYNVTVYPYNMTQFRQALAYGINKTEVVSNGFNGYSLAADDGQGEVPTTASASYYPNIANYSYNPQMAIQLLNGIGIHKGSDGYLQYPNGTDITLQLWADTDQSWDQLTGTVVQQNLQSLGFKVNLVTASLSAIIGDYHSNLDNIQHGMLIYTNHGLNLGDPYFGNFPGWDTWWAVASAPDSNIWESPASANTEYYSNLTAFEGTANHTLETQYTDNIQALNAKYLPMIVLSYPDYLWVANKQYWSNWPSGYIIFGGQRLNITALATLTPAGTATSSSSSSSGTSNTTSSSLTGATSSVSSSSNTAATTSLTATTSSAASSASSSSSSSSSLTLYAAIAVIVIIVIAAVVALTMRRRPRGT